MQYAATFGYRRLAAAAGRAPRRAAASRTTARSRRAWACRRFRRSPRRSRCARSSSWCARPARACTCAGCRRADGVDAGARGEARRACRSPATSASITCICATSTSAGSTRNAASTPPLRSTRDRDALRAGAGRRHDRRDLLRPHAGRRRRQAAAVRRSRAGRDRARAAAAADAQMGARGASCRCATALARITVDAARDRSASPPARSRVGAPRRRVRVRSARRAGRVAPEALRSQGKNTPFLGYELAGRVRYTLVGGNVVHDASRG